MTSRRQYCVRFDWPEIWTSDLPLQKRTRYRSTKPSSLEREVWGSNLGPVNRTQLACLHVHFWEPVLSSRAWMLLRHTLKKVNCVIQNLFCVWLSKIQALKLRTGSQKCTCKQAKCCRLLATAATIHLKKLCCPGAIDAEMGPANSLHALTYYSEYHKRNSSNLLIWVFHYLTV